MRAPALALAVAMLSTATVYAACSDDVAEFAGKLDTEAHDVGARTSGGQADAAARSAKAEQAATTGTPVADLPKPPSADNSSATREAARDGGGGGDVMSAKATLNDARIAAGKGDEAACASALARAKTQARR